MKKNIFAIIALLGIVLAGGCNQGDTGDSSSSNKNDNVTITTSTTVAGTKISALSLSSLQTQITNAETGSVLDLSECSIYESGTLTVNKSLTIRNFNSDSVDVSLTSADITLTGVQVSNVSTSGSGSSGLKIANSSLSTLTIGGSSVNANVTAVSRSTESTATVALVNASVYDTVTFKEPVELNIYGFSAGVGSFEVEGNISVTVNMTESAKSEYGDISIDGITFKTTITEDDVYAKTAEFGLVSGIQYYSDTFPESAVKYVHELVDNYISGIASFPIPTFTGTTYVSEGEGTKSAESSELNVQSSKFIYYYVDADALGDNYGIFEQFDYREMAVVASSQTIDSSYSTALINAGFKYQGSYYILTNNPFTTVGSDAEDLANLKSMSGKLLYSLMVEFEDSSVSFTAMVMMYDYDKIMTFKE